MKLSVIVTGIRPKEWVRLYRSFHVSCSLPKSEYEFVFISPYSLPNKIKHKKNVRLIRDFGCLTRCSQLGLLHSRGEYVTLAGDDGIIMPNLAIDHAFKIIPNHYKGIVSLKFYEGHPPPQANPKWWRLGYHSLAHGCEYAPDDYFLTTIPFMRRQYLVDIGGWDCRYEHLGLGSVDLAIRLQNDGAEVVMGSFFQRYELLKGNQGDHGPVRAAHRQNDKPLFSFMYKQPENENRTKIEFDNWKNSPEVWGRRFK